MGVSFVPHGRLHFLDPGDQPISRGDAVLVPTEHGPEVARCVWGPTEADWDGAPLPPCGGRASDSDLARDAQQRRVRAEIRALAEALIAEHRLPMTVVAVDYADRRVEVDRLAVVYFKAPHRVDFRALLGELARGLRCRIDLRRVGARDTAALVGGVGPCGREFCCVHAPVAEPVPARVSREQEATNHALQVAGGCGRLKCCLAYERDAYVDFDERAPAVGSVVRTPHGEGVVAGLAQPADAVWVRTDEALRLVPVGQAELVCPAPTADASPGRDR